MGFKTSSNNSQDNKIEINLFYHDKQLHFEMKGADKIILYIHQY